MSQTWTPVNLPTLQGSGVPLVPHVVGLWDVHPSLASTMGREPGAPSVMRVCKGAVDAAPTAFCLISSGQIR